MKMRLGYVTNSSSSSFVIARKSDIKESEIVELIIEKLSNDIKRELEDEWQIKYLDNDIKIAILQKDFDKAIKLVADELSDRLLDTYSEMELGDWKVHSEEFDNENGFYENLIYSYGNKLVSDRFKIG